MKTFLYVTATTVSLIFGAQTFGQSLDDTKSCVIVYVKYDNSQPNLTISCDGNRVLTHVIPTEDKVPQPAENRATLFKAFQTIVNPSGRKKCQEYDYEKVWWASCLSQ